MCYYQGLTVAASPVEAAAFKELFFVIAGGTLLFFVGLADDLSGLSYKPKFVAQILVGVLLIYGGVGIENLGGCSVCPHSVVRRVGADRAGDRPAGQRL